MAKNKKRTHDIFISYSTKDKNAANAICHELESNGLKCWIAPRDIQGGVEYAQEIIDGIENSKILVLVFSKNSQASPYVTNEIANAFEKNKPIISYKIDETMPRDKMEYYLADKHWLESYPDYKNLFKTLVRDAKRLIDDIPNPPGFFDKYKIPIIIAVALILIAVVGLVALNGNDTIDTSTVNSSSTDIVIDYIGKDDDRGKGYTSDYSYFVFGSIPSQLSNSSKDVVHTDYYDDSGKIVHSNDTKIGDTEDNILSRAYLDNGDISKVSVELRDSDGNVISSAESEHVK